MSEEIVLCNKKEPEIPQDIVLCNEPEEPAAPEDIVLCNDPSKNGKCATSPDLTISATSPLSVSDVVGASGGVPPYSYGFDAGTINHNTGEITSLISCGASGTPRGGTVSVTDACGETASVEVRLAGGSWQIVDTYSVNVFNDPCGASTNRCGWDGSYTHSCGPIIEGLYRYQYSYILTLGYEAAGKIIEDCGLPPERCVPDFSCISANFPYATRITSRTTEQWRCP